MTVTNPTASPAQVRAALIAAAEQSPLGGDPDGLREPIVNVSRL